jgi:hypothetical protein
VEGKRGKLANAVRGTLQNDEGEYADWLDAMGKLVERRAADRDRKALEKAKRKAREEEERRRVALRECGGSSEEFPPNRARISEESPQNGGGISAATERDGTERDGTGLVGSSGSSRKRSGAVAAPPARAGNIELPPAAVEFVERFYGDATARRRADIERQLSDATTPRGARLDRKTRVHAGSRDRLNAKCLEVLAEGVRDLDKAIRVLLIKLSDVSDGSAPGVRQAEIEDAEARRDEREFAQMEAWIEGQPEHLDSVNQILAFEGLSAAGNDPFRAVQYQARRRSLVRERWEKRGAE